MIINHCFWNELDSSTELQSTDSHRSKCRGNLNSLYQIYFLYSVEFTPCSKLRETHFILQKLIPDFLRLSRPTTLSLNINNNRSVSTVSALRNYYTNNQEIRSDFQSPISEVPPSVMWKRPSLWDIPDPDYSPASTVTRLKNDTDSQYTRLRHSLFNPVFPLRPSLKKKPQNFERKEDFRH